MKKAVEILFLLAVAVWLSCPLWMGPSAKFEGTDGQGEAMIHESHPGYQPWFERPWNGGSSEVQSGLFALQAALGAGVLGYVIGYYKGRRRD